MNAAIAELLKLRLASFTYVDKLGGLVRPITFQRAGKNITIPVSITVDDPLACPDSTLLELVPNEAYRLIVYFEDRGLTPNPSRTRGMSYTSNIRLVCWVNTKKLGGDNSAGDRIMQEFLGSMRTGMYNEGPFAGIRHKVESIPQKGAGLFSAYSYDAAVRQYLMWPFDAFAIDIATEFRLNPNCDIPIDPTNVACWTPPTTRRKRNPSEFTCEELLDPTTGLTAEQLGPECLDCAGALPCADATVNINGTEVGTPASGATLDLDVVDQDGNPIGSLVSGQWVVTIPEEVDNILPYTDRAAALADTTTIPQTNQFVVVSDVGRTYIGNGISNVAALVANPQVMLLPVREDGALFVTVEGVEYKLQLNA